MSDKTKTPQDANIEVPENSQGQEQSPQPPVNGKVYDVEVSFPPEITIHHIQAYKTGQKRYEKAVRLASEEPDTEWLSLYYGAKELVDRGFVHIKGLEPVIEALKQQNQAAVSGQVVAWMIINIAQPFEARIASPLGWRPSSKK